MEAFDRIGLAVHPRRELDSALATVREWAERQGAEIVQVAGGDREVAPRGKAADCDLVIALGGDGTALAALHAAAPAGKPVLGVACGSLGALTATTADKLDAALEPASHRATGGRASLPGLRAAARRRGDPGPQRPRARPRGRRPGDDRGPGRRRALRPLLRRRPRRRHAARLHRLHARLGRADAGAGRDRARADAAVAPRRGVPAARHGGRAPSSRSRWTPATAARGSRSTVRSATRWSGSSPSRSR